MQLGIATEDLDAYASELRDAAASIEEAATAEDVADAMKVVARLVEGDLPEWLRDARRAVQDFASSLSV